MEIAKVQITGNIAKVLSRKPIVSGTIGATGSFVYDESWEGMDKTLVWSAGGVTKDDTTASGIIPAEVLARPNTRLKVGVYGTKDGTATPTVWADLGMILPGADPSGDESTDPSLPVWAQVQRGMVKAVNGIKPDENGNVQMEAITAPSTAAVGQTIVVKAVDESGKPAEWKAVDLPGGGEHGVGITAITIEEV